MTKQAQIEPEKEGKPHPRQMKLRSSGSLLPLPSKVIPSIKKESMIGDRELDEMKIIRDFQMKRKLLMKILKQKQKQKVSGITTMEPFHVKEGILEFQNLESKEQKLVLLTIKEAIDFDSRPKDKPDIDPLKESTDPTQSSSQKMDVAVQTERNIQRRQRFERGGSKIGQITQKKITKEGEKVRMKKTKKTKEEIEKLKTQITSLFVIKHSENESHSESSSQSQSLLSSDSGTTYDTYITEMISVIQNLNKEIEVYYEGKYLKQVILDQYNKNYNRRKNQRKKQADSQSSKDLTDDIDLNDSDYIQVCKNEVNLKIKNNCRKIHTQEEKGPTIQYEQDRKSKKSKRYQQKYKGNRGLLNERFQMVVQQQSRQSQFFKESKQKDSISQEQAPRNRKKIERQMNGLDQQKWKQMVVQDQSETDVGFDRSKAWIKEFNIQVEVIYTKYPKLRKYQLSQKVFHSQNKQIQINQIKKFCKKKTKKIVKRSKISSNKSSKLKNLKEKYRALAKEKNDKDSLSSPKRSEKNTKQKNRNQNIKKKPMKLKEIQIGKFQEEEFCKSFDHRSRKGEKFRESQISQIISHDMRDNEVYNQIYDAFYDKDEHNKSLEFYFQSGTDKGLNDSLSERKSVKLEARKETVTRSMSKSLVGSSREMEGDKRLVSRRINEISFFKSEEGNDYFQMSGENPLNF